MSGWLSTLLKGCPCAKYVFLLCCACVCVCVCVCLPPPRLDEHGHLKIYLPKKLLECLPKCSSLPKERHRWNTNEVSLPSLIPQRSPPSITLPTQPSARHIDLSALAFSFFFFFPETDRFLSNDNILLGIQAHIVGLHNAHLIRDCQIST